MREYDCVYVFNNGCDTRMRPIFSQLINHYLEWNNISNIMSPMRDLFFALFIIPGGVSQMLNQLLMDIHVCWWNMII